MLRDIVGVSATPSRDDIRVCNLSTLRHFDSKLEVMVNNGPLIPWERRLRNMEIPEFQEVTSWTRFGKQGLRQAFST